MTISGGLKYLTEEISFRKNNIYHFTPHARISRILHIKVSSVYSTGEIPHMRCTFTSYEVLRSRNSNSTKKRRMCNPFRKEDSVFISHSTLQNHFCLGLSSFGELKF